MNNLHAKSPCCRGRIIKFGKRRKRCGLCGMTWRIKKKKRGRKRLRVNSQMVIRYLSRKKFFFKRTVNNKEWIRHRLELSLNYYLNHTAFEFPPAGVSLIAIVDGMWELIENQIYTTYLVLLRPIDSSQSWIMPPLIFPGKESDINWLAALENIPPHLKTRIKAVVCDGDPHLVRQAKQQGWIIQRCHFHLLASIKNYVTAGPLSRNRRFGQKVLKTVQSALYTTDNTELERLIRKIILLVRLAKNRKLKSRLRGLVKNIEDFRTYQKYQEWNLPVTSNAAESLVQCIRDVLYRARGFRTIASFRRWITAICLFKKTITCNGKYQPN